MQRGRAFSIAGLSGTAALVAAAGGASWYYASRLTQPPMDAVEPPPLDDLVELVEVGEDHLALRGPGASRPGRWGVDAPSGYAQVGPVLATTGVGDLTLARRSATTIAGTLTAGETAVLDAYAHPPTAAALHPTAVEVRYDTPVGPAPAWFVPGERGTWAIAVHGRGGRRHEAFRAAPSLIACGLPLLAIAYRNDGEGPRSPDGRSHLGAREWEDVEAAIRFALQNGADDVVLLGFSMGGACVTAAVRLSPLASRVRALVLEAPVLDWGPVVHRAALARGLPAAVLPALLPATMAFARWRVGIDWSTLRPDPAALDVPTLLFHGDADDVVPVELSDAFAAARPDIVRYVRVVGARHVECWNAAPDAWDRELRGFLRDVLGLG